MGKNCWVKGQSGEMGREGKLQQMRSPSVKMGAESGLSDTGYKDSRRGRW